MFRVTQVYPLNYVNFNLHFTNVRIVVILLVISENIASCASFYFRTSTFEKVLDHWLVFKCVYSLTSIMRWGIETLPHYKYIEMFPINNLKFPPTPSSPPIFGGSVLLIFLVFSVMSLILLALAMITWIR